MSDLTGGDNTEIRGAEDELIAENQANLDQNSPPGTSNNEQSTFEDDQLEHAQMIHDLKKEQNHSRQKHLNFMVEKMKKFSYIDKIRIVCEIF